MDRLQGSLTYLSLEVSGEANVSKRYGSQILELTCEKAMKAYQLGMGSVDHSDQYRERGAGFATKAHYKKCYKKAYFAIINFMTLNAFLPGTCQ